MPRTAAPRPDDPAQSKRFIETARDIETDDSPEEFERVFKIARRKPKASPPKDPL